MAETIVHLLIAVGAGGLAGLVGLTAGLEGQVLFFGPVVVLAGFAAVLAGRWEATLSRPRPLLLLALPLAWFLAFVAWEDWYGWPVGLEASYTGADYCGDFTCAGQLVVTMPFVAALAYAAIFSIPASARARPDGNQLVVFFGVIFTLVWFGLSASTQRPPVLAHLSPHYARGGMPHATDWCILVARDEFRGRGLYDQQQAAGAFFDTAFANEVRRSYFDPGDFRQTFIRASTQGQLNSYVDSSDRRWSYRNLVWSSRRDDGRLRRDIPRLTRDAAIVALLLSFAGFVAWRRASRPPRDT
jgi:hypothetical protein